MLTRNFMQSHKDAPLKKVKKKVKITTRIQTSDLLPKFPVLVVEDQVIAAKKAVAAMKNFRYSYQGTTYQADLQGYEAPTTNYRMVGGKFISHDLDFFKYMLDSSTPFPAIAVFNNTLTTAHISKF